MIWPFDWYSRASVVSTVLNKKIINCAPEHCAYELVQIPGHGVVLSTSNPCCAFTLRCMLPISEDVVMVSHGVTLTRTHQHAKVFRSMFIFYLSWSRIELLAARTTICRRPAGDGIDT